MRSPLTYYGGKNTMLKHILPLIPPHRIYTESFAGGASVLFAKARCECEIINDLNGEIVNFYHVVKNHYPALKKEIDSTLHSRDIHEHANHILNYPYFFNPVKRAWAVWTLSKMSFAANLDGPFGYDFDGGMSLKLQNSKDLFTQSISKRLEYVTIENRDALQIISAYDQKDTFHFVDPPYVGTTCGHYDNMFNEKDLQNLLDLLSNIQGKFMLTMFPHAMINEYTQRNSWFRTPVQRTISASKTTRRKQEEWITTNYLVQTRLSLFQNMY